MFKIRQISYSKNTVSIQVYKIENRKRKIVRHIGTAKSEVEKQNLLHLAHDFIEKATKQLFLFETATTNKIINIDQLDFQGILYRFYYEFIYSLIFQIGFDKIKSPLLLDLVVIRMFEPASKLRSIELIDQYFGVKHRRQSFYESALKWLDLKDKVEKSVLKFAREHYSFTFDLLFYDVTTLYFETFQEDELRKNGFSKDNKSQQPQVLVALMVSKEGFPISYEVFAGNTFEGHTILPVIKKFIKKNKVKNFTIVADAAMISDENIHQFKKEQINYIVGARLGNLSQKTLQEIDDLLIKKDNYTARIKTEKGYLVCSYSSLRYRKDKYEMKKQLDKAKAIIKNPSKNRKVKFTQENGDNKLELNKKLIRKTIKLLGVKGYYTNLNEELANNQLVISRYHELYRIEQAFRISKNDLETRPIYHFKEEPIKLHLLICFLALVISKHIEIKGNISIKKFNQECKKVVDARLINKITGKELIKRSYINPNLMDLLQKISC